MDKLAIKGDNDVLARWNYSRQEWGQYQAWHKRKKSFFHFLLHFLNPFKRKNAPEITITHDCVCIGEKHHPFSSEDHELKAIGIRDAGKFNLLEISCRPPAKSKMGSKEIRIPVPKGKLREAIDIQSRLVPE